MVMTPEEKEKAMHIYKCKQAINQRHMDKLRGDKERSNNKGRPRNEEPTDEYLEQLLIKRQEANAKKCKQRNPQTRDEIIAAINKLTKKLERLEQEEMKGEDKQ